MTGFKSCNYYIGDYILKSVKSLLLLFVCMFNLSCVSNTVCVANNNTRVSQELLINEAYNNENWENAEIFINEYLKTHPNDAEKFYQLGNVYVNTLRPEAAIRSYKYTLKLDPSHDKARHNLGVVYLKLGLYEISASRKTLPMDDYQIKRLKDIFEGM